MSTSAQQPALTFSELVGSNARSRLLEYLAATDGGARQFKIADDLNLSQASVSRAASGLIEIGAVSRGESGELVLEDGVKWGIATIHNSLGESS